MQSIVGLLVVVIFWLACEVAEKPPTCIVPSGGIHIDHYPPKEE